MDTSNLFPTARRVALYALIAATIAAAGVTAGLSPSGTAAYTAEEPVLGANESMIAANESVPASDESMIATNEPVLATNEPVPATDEPVPGDPESAGSILSWGEVDRLVSEQKFQAAADQVAKIREAARTAGNDPEWARALIEEVKLRIALHGYETSVRFLKEQPWPDDPMSRAALDLYYADALATYVKRYGREIRQRERVVADEEIDLKAWTVDQISTEAHRAYARIWAAREEWGGESIGMLAPYIDQNDYPARIRGTLRDAVTYLWVELLDDRSLWRPEQSNELFRLDVQALIAGDPTASATMDLTDAQVHPVAKVGAILDDLEAWHHGAHRPEAALEARLERLRQMQRAFDQQEDDRLAVRRSLESVLAGFDRSYDWWSMGQAQLAEFLRKESDPDALIRAREAALAGSDRHPESIGGRRCAHIVAQIEAPSFEVAAMASDGPDKRSIRIEHRNMPRLHFRAWRYDLAQRIAASTSRDLLPRQGEVAALVDSLDPDFTWEVELPGTPDYRSHTTYATAPIPEPGAYLVAVSARSDFAQEANQIQAVNIIIGDLVLVTRALPGLLEVTARSGASGQPLAGVEVLLHRFGRDDGHELVDQKHTGTDGIARFESVSFERARYFLLARLGEQVALDQNHPYPGGDRSRDKSASAFIYTDRSVYRPGQPVYWKVVAYSGGGEEPRYETLPETPISVTLLDANGETVATEDTRTNDFGSATGQFLVPGGRLLGRWRIRTTLGGDVGIQIEEYKRPTFEVEVGDPEAPLRLNRPAALTGSVRYYFGLPVVSGQVHWRVTREPVYPRWWWWQPPAARKQLVATGETSLDADGHFAIEFTPEIDEREAGNEGISYNYRLEVDVTDDGGETRSANRNFRLGFVTVEARISSDTAFFLGGQRGALTVTRSDLNGTPRAGRGAWRLVTLKQPGQALLPADEPLPVAPGADVRYRTAGDGLRPRWLVDLRPETVLAQWEEGETIAAADLEHGADGLATIELPELEPGPYRLLYESKDDFGVTCRARREFLVAGEEHTPVALPCLLLAERSSVPVGETARILVRSALPDQQLVLEFYRDGRRFDRRVLETGRDGELIQIPVTTKDRGGFGVTLTALRDHQLMLQSQQIFVPWDDRELTVEFSTFRDRLRPGTQETFRVTVRGNDEQRIESGAAELLAYMYDRSLDVFAPHRPPNPLGLYPNRSGLVRAQSTLGWARRAWGWKGAFGSVPGYPRLRGDRLKDLSGYGIGGPGARRFLSHDLQSIEVSEAIGLKAGVVSSGTSELHFRGGRSGESIWLSAGSSGEADDLVVPPAPSPFAPPSAESPVELRTDFSETAFFSPQLLLDDDGSATIEFEVPDAVTDWNVWVHALTRDLRSGSAHRQTASVKELMVRPYLPRFLREGDQAAIKVIVNNAGDEPFTGTLDFAILDPETDEDLRAGFGIDPAATTGVPFTVGAGGGTDLIFPVEAPSEVGAVAFKVTARAGAFSDGEIRALPILPGRLHLMQSRFVTLQNRTRRELHFADLAADDDPTRIDDQLVVRVDAQLFYSVLSSLPYLVDYPYECSEQLLNRFVSTGIVTSLYDDYPEIAQMAEEFSKRQTQLETWDTPDPNRKMALEETPWLVEARGGSGDPDRLTNVLDPRRSRAARDEAIAKLESAQTSAGAFPWWPGGPPSTYMTLYVLYGLSKALEFGVEIPKPMVVQAWRYMHRQYLDDLVQSMIADDCCWETVTFLNYALSNYPDGSWTGGVFTDDDRKRMLDYSFAHWRDHSPLLKVYLALTLARADRAGDARLVFDSVMDSAKSDEDLGTYWAPEDRAWLWYNDTIETHAFALRTLTELQPDDSRRHGLVQWLFLNKKLNHWKSTRATAEVIYSLVHYLKHEGAVALREEMTVAIGPRTESFVFEPGEYTGGRNQVVVAGDEIDPATMATVVVKKSTPGFAFASATWHFSTERLPDEARGDLFTVTRSYFRRVNVGDEWVLRPLTAGERIETGDQLEVQLSIRAKHAAEYVHLRDPRGAGFEPETTTSRHRWELGLGYYEEIRDSGANFFFERLPAGEFTLKYRVRANMAGSFRVGPATLQAMYAPEFAAYSAGERLEVSAK